MAQRIKNSSYTRRRVVLFTLLIVFFFLGGLWWFSYLDIINVMGLLTRLQIINRVLDNSNNTDQLLLEKERIAKRELAVQRLQADIERRENRVTFLEAQVTSRQQELQEYEAQINDREKTLNNSQQLFENRREVIANNIEILRAMRPEDAVSILSGYDDQLLVDTLVLEEEIAQQNGRLSFVSIWLSQLDPERAAAIQRKVVLKYGTQ